jgi:hypothetical protein
MGSIIIVNADVIITEIINYFKVRKDSISEFKKEENLSLFWSGLLILPLIQIQSFGSYLNY